MSTTRSGGGTYKYQGSQYVLTKTLIRVTNFKTLVSLAVVSSISMFGIAEKSYALVQWKKKANYTKVKKKNLLSINWYELSPLNMVKEWEEPITMDQIKFQEGYHFSTCKSAGLLQVPVFVLCVLLKILSQTLYSIRGDL